MNFYKFCEAKVAPSGLTSLHDWYIITLQKLVHFSIAIYTFTLGLSVEIERNMISQGTMEALARKKKEGKKLGRPKGSLAKVTKLSGKENETKVLLEKGIG